MGNPKPSKGPKVEPFKDWSGVRKYRGTCEQHGYSIECFLEQNASDALRVHEAHMHGKKARPSQWSIAKAGSIG